MAAQPYFIAGRYRLINKIGEGGMGVVYAAYDRLNNQSIALKRVTSFSGDGDSDSRAEEARLSLSREFRALSALRHPNIIEVQDYGFDEVGQPYFTMTLLHDPQTIVEAGQDLTLEGKVQLIVEGLHALTYVHRRRLIHRDLKPSNILVDADSGLKLLDFGLAKDLLSASTGSKGGVVVGTLMHVAPELFSEPRPTVLSDLYSMGLIAYEMLTGKYPFRAQAITQLITQIINEKPDFSALPPALLPVIQRMIAKDPVERYPSVESAVAALCEAMGWELPQSSVVVLDSLLQASRFIGRSAELTMLNQALNAARRGSGSLWLVAGESGVGKTRLLAELRTQALIHGVLVLTGQSMQDGGMMYQLWRGPVRRLLLTSHVIDAEASILKDIVPDIEQLLDREVPFAPPLEGEASHQRMIDTIVSLLQAQGQPILIILEDLQWAVEGLDVLKQINEIVDDLPILIVASYRDDERADLPAQLLGAPVLRLARLSEDEIMMLSLSMLGTPGANPQLVDLLKRETEGNPFFIVEVIRTLASSADNPEQVGNQTLPEHLVTGGMRRLLERRLGDLPDAALHLLTLAAIAGRKIDRPVIEALATDEGLEIDVDAWLIDCANRAVLEVHEDIGWEFSHDKLREYLLGKVDEADRPAFYRQVALIYEALYPDAIERADYMANLWRHAGDSEREMYYLAIAADQEWHISMYHTALGYYLRLYQLLSDSRAGQDHSEILLRLTQAAFHLDQYGEAHTHGQLALNQANHANNPHNVARALHKLAQIAIVRGQYVEARGLLNDALEIVEALDAPETAGWIHYVIGDLQWRERQLDAAIPTLEYALTITPDEAASLRMHILNRLGVVQMNLNQIETARRYYGEGRELAIQTFNRERQAVFENNLGKIALDAGDLDEATTHFERALALNSGVGRGSAMALNLLNMGDVLFRRGNLTGAQDYLGRGLRIAWDTGAKASVLLGLAMFAMLYAGSKRRARAVEILRTVRAHPSLDSNTQIFIRYVQGRYAISDEELARGGEPLPDLETLVQRQLR